MIAVLLAAGLAVVPVQAMTPEESGRLAFNAGFCSAGGWVLQEGGEAQLNQQLYADHPEVAPEELRRRMVAGAEAFQAEILARVGALRTPADAERLAEEFRVQCDRIAAERPDLLRRTPETDARWAVAVQGLLRRVQP